MKFGSTLLAVLFLASSILGCSGDADRPMRKSADAKFGAQARFEMAAPRPDEPIGEEFNTETTTTSTIPF